MTSSLLLF